MSSYRIFVISGIQSYAIKNYLLALKTILWELKQEKDTGYSDKWQTFFRGWKIFLGSKSICVGDF
jgi:hypothetical protein